jgi:cysteine synthase A
MDRREHEQFDRAIARRLGPDATVGTLIVDTGLKYLSTEVYRAGR